MTDAKRMQADLFRNAKRTAFDFRPAANGPHSERSAESSRSWAGRRAENWRIFFWGLGGRTICGRYSRRVSVRVCSCDENTIMADMRRGIDYYLGG